MCISIVSNAMKNSKINSTPNNNKGRTKDRTCGNNSQHCNWSQEEIDTMDKDNSTNNVRKR
jgi:hypothetical protein